MMRAATIAAVVWLEVIRRKDVYVLLILMSSLLVVLVSLDVFGLGEVARYVLDVGLLITWIFGWILAVTVSARQLPQEETRGTAFSLLAKPVTRFDVVLGKWLGAWSVVTAATAAFYVLAIGTTVLKGARVDMVPTLQAVLLHALALGVIAAMAVLMSCRMNSDAAISLSFVLTGASLVLVPRIPHLLTQSEGASERLLLFVYNVLPHFEVFDMRRRVVHDFGPAPWSSVGLATLYGLTLIALFLALAWIAYRHKRLSREAIA